MIHSWSEYIISPPRQHSIEVRSIRSLSADPKCNVVAAFTGNPNLHVPPRVYNHKSTSILLQRCPQRQSKCLQLQSSCLHLQCLPQPGNVPAPLPSPTPPESTLSTTTTPTPSPMMSVIPAPSPPVSHCQVKKSLMCWMLPPSCQISLAALQMSCTK